MNYYKVFYLNELGKNSFYVTDSTILKTDDVMCRAHFYAYELEDGLHDVISGELIEDGNVLNTTSRLLYEEVCPLTHECEIKEFKRIYYNVNTNIDIKAAYLNELTNIANSRIKYKDTYKLEK